MLDGDNLSMSNYNVAEAEDRLSDLIDRALTGERVIVTRDGVPIIEFKPIRESELKAIEPKPITQEDIEWLAAHRIEYDSPPFLNAGELVSQMRDEGEH